MELAECDAPGGGLEAMLEAGFLLMLWLVVTFCCKFQIIPSATKTCNLGGFMKFLILCLLLFSVRSIACTTTDMSKIAGELIEKLKKSRSIDETYISNPHIRPEGKDQIYEAFLYLKLKSKDEKITREVVLITAKLDGKICSGIKPFFTSGLNSYPVN